MYVRASASLSDVLVFAFFSGFTTKSKPWLPINPNYWRLNVEAQQAAENSHLKVYQLMAKAKQTKTLKSGGFGLTAPDDSIMIIER